MFRGLFNREKGKSKDRLKDRLKLVLSYDRAELTPGKMEALKGELLDVIAKYFPTDKSQYDIKLEQRDGHMVFIANVPVK